MTKDLQSSLCQKLQAIPFPVCEGDGPGNSIYIVDWLSLQSDLHWQQIFNILDPNDSGKCFEGFGDFCCCCCRCCFLVFSLSPPLFLTLLTLAHIYTHTPLKYLPVSTYMQINIFCVLALGPVSGKEIFLSFYLCFSFLHPPEIKRSFLSDLPSLQSSVWSFHINGVI